MFSTTKGSRDELTPKISDMANWLTYSKFNIFLKLKYS